MRKYALAITLLAACGCGTDPAVRSPATLTPDSGPADRQRTTSYDAEAPANPDAPVPVPTDPAGAHAPRAGDTRPAADARPPDVTPDGPPPSTDAFFGPSRCPTAGTLLCEGFESGALDTAVWNVR